MPQTLQRAGQHVILLERGDIGAALTTRYYRLRLHTVRWLSSVPGYRGEEVARLRAPRLLHQKRSPGGTRPAQAG